MNLETRQYADVQLRSVDSQNRRITVVISTFDLDSHGTRIDQNGWDFSVFQTNPVIPLSHDARGDTGSNGLPVAKGIPNSIRVDNQRTTMEIEFPPPGAFPLADTVYELARNGFINAVSVGFEPMDWEDQDEEDADGNMQRIRIFRKQRLLEVSIVTIPSNSNALIQRARKFNREDEIDTFRSLAKKAEDLVANFDPVRWNRSLSRVFDVAQEKIDPAALEYDWVAKHIGCEVKEIFQNSFAIPSYRIGGFLLGLRHALMGSRVEEVRNLTFSGTELPPVYNEVELNSRQSEDFLVDGIAFCKSDEGNFAYRVYPTWRGLHMDFYTHRQVKDFNRKTVEGAWRFARENNPLKGEAFALSGEFIRTTDETWEDCFLEDKNQKALQRVVDRLNEKGKDTPNRGLILMGPPGTGKTLSGRIIRNTLKDCSFIWVSTRDFYYGGGFTQAFDLAREIAPAVLFFEDIDNWIDRGSIDLLKTEMDGIARSTGVVTILTTNFPERLPEALIDRPGRFHDVLNFNLPTDEKRAAMLKKWVDGLSDNDIEEAVKQTKGYSGAHVFELASFTRNIQESDGLTTSEALREALKKIKEQKDLITSLQLQGSNYRPRRQLNMRVERNGDTLSATMENPTQPIDYKAYFEKKQPANKAATKALEKFFKTRGMKQPDDEVEAWQRMTDIIEEEKGTVEIKPEEEIEVEAKPVTETEVIEAPEKVETEPIIPEPPAEAPQDERKASVHIPLSLLAELPGNLARNYADAAVEALRRGIPVKDAVSLIDGMNDAVSHSLSQYSYHGNS